MKHIRLGTLIGCMGLLLGFSACSGSSTITRWNNYPHLFTQAINQPWLVLMCKVNDNATEPDGVLAQARRFFTVGGMGQGNIADYFSDISYGKISLVGTQVMGWYTAPFSSHDLKGRLFGPQHRGDRVKECANAVPDADVDFGGYWGILMVTNIPDDAGACAQGKMDMAIHEHTYHVGCVVLDQNSLYTAIAAHEVGHGYGFAHSYDSTKCEYCDPWDIMSAQQTQRFAGANFPPNADTQNYLAHNGGDQYDGPGMNVPNLLHQGWIPNPRIAVYNVGNPDETYTLAALSHPNASGLLTVEMVGNNANDVYTIEYRQKDGWDAGITQNAVLIHEYQIGEDPWSFLQKGGDSPSGEWLPGMTWNDSGPTVSVTVNSIDASAGTASITIKRPSLFNTQPRITIVAPVNSWSTSADQPFQLVATATNYAGQTLPDQAVTWQIDATTLGTGKIRTTSIATKGDHTITAIATDHGERASASVIIRIHEKPPNPPPTPSVPPTVQILSPQPDASFTFYTGESFTLTLASSTNRPVTSYQWSDSLGLFTDTLASDTLTVNAPFDKVACQPITDVITLKVTDAHGLTGSDQHSIDLHPVCLH